MDSKEELKRIKREKIQEKRIFKEIKIRKINERRKLHRIHPDNEKKKAARKVVNRNSSPIFERLRKRSKVTYDDTKRRRK